MLECTWAPLWDQGPHLHISLILVHRFWYSWFPINQGIANNCSFYFFDSEFHTFFYLPCDFHILAIFLRSLIFILSYEVSPRSLVILLLNHLKPAHIWGTIILLIILVLCVCFIGMTNIRNPKFTVINLLNDGDIIDVSSWTEVINLRTLEVSSLEIRQNFVKIWSVIIMQGPYVDVIES